MTEKYVFRKRLLELPGFFRPTKEWDLLVVKDGHLIAVIEAKSQVGPSLGNNFNNRTEEAMGSAIDLWKSYRRKSSKVEFNHISVTFLCSRIVMRQIVQ